MINVLHCTHMAVLTPDQIRRKLAGEVLPEVEQRIREDQKKQDTDAITEQINKIQALQRGRKLTTAEIREGLDLLFQKYDFSPVENLILLCLKGKLSTDQEIRINMFLTEFLIPKLKSVEVKGQVDHVHTVVVRRYGPEKQILDTPLAKKVPGLPDPEKPARPVGRDPVTLTVDAEVSRG